MAVTIIVYQETPFENIEGQLNHYLSQIPFCAEKSFKGIMSYAAIYNEAYPKGLFGYILDIQDEVIHTEDLWVVYMGANDHDNPNFLTVCELLTETTGARVANYYWANPNAIAQFDRGAEAIRSALIQQRRGSLRAVC